LALQVRMLERAWPEALGPVVTQLRDASRAAERWASAHLLQPKLSEEDPLRARLDEEVGRARAELDGLLPRLLAESPAAFARRMKAYWDAWRG
jgi:hypothetical protein